MPLRSDLDVVSPATLADALSFLAEHADEGWAPVAGGTDVMVRLEYGIEKRTRWIDLSRFAGELAAIGEEEGRIRVGGGATMTAVRRSSLLADACPLLGAAAATVGAIPIQNRATVAGNLVNASPAGDTLPVWLVLDAEVELASGRGTRRVPYREFTPSYRTTVRRPDELVTAVRFEPPPKERSRLLFRKVGTRAVQAISKVVVAGLLRTDATNRLVDVRLAFGSMAPVPVRATAAEREAIGRAPSVATGRAAAERLDADLSPIDDVRSTAAYRMRVARNLTREFLAGRLGEPPPVL
jgi:CO/xanthine dehydrogenase FAD-binding subunit